MTFSLTAHPFPPSLTGRTRSLEEAPNVLLYLVRGALSSATRGQAGMGPSPFAHPFSIPTIVPLSAVPSSFHPPRRTSTMVLSTISLEVPSGRVISTRM